MRKLKIIIIIIVMFLWNIGTHGRSKDGGYMFFWMLVSTYQMAWVINQRPQYDWYLYYKKKSTSIFTNSLKGCISTKRHFHIHMCCHSLLHLAFTIHSKMYGKSFGILLYICVCYIEFVYPYSVQIYQTLWENEYDFISEENSINPAHTGWDRCHIEYSALSGTPSK